MNCGDFRKIAECWADGELPKDSLARAERHLSSCASCSREAASLKAFNQKISQLGFSSTPPSSNFAAGFWQKVYARDKEPWFQGVLRDLQFTLPVPQPAQVFAVLLAAFLVGGTAGVVSARPDAELRTSTVLAAGAFSGFQQNGGAAASASLAEVYLKKT